MLSRPLFCFLLALHIPLTYFADNQAFFQFSGVVRTLILFQAFTLVLYWLGRKAFGSTVYATAAASAPLIFYWVSTLDVTYAVLATAVGVAVILLMARLLDKEKTIVLLNIGMLAVLLQPLFQIASQSTSNNFMEIDSSLFRQQKSSLALDKPDLKREDEPPSILHLTLDAYASDAVLAEIIGFDNSAFSKSLEELGFTVFPDVVSPYNQTLLTMPAIFSGDYLDLDRVALLEGFSRIVELAQLEVAGHVRETLSNLGYTFAYNQNGVFSPRYPKGAMVSEQEKSFFDLSKFESVFIVQRVFSLYENVRHQLVNIVETPGMANPKGPQEATKPTAENFQFPLISLLKANFKSDFITTLEPPFFYTFHAIAPHPPFTIDRDGNQTTRWLNEFGSISGGSHAHHLEPALQEQYKLGYIEKLLYTNQATLEFVERTLSNVRTPLIIIIHGDHGSGVLLDVDSPEHSCLQERYSPYLAIYSSSPEIGERLKQSASARFNLVNIYRVLFDELFEQDIQLEEDQSFFVSYDKPDEGVQIEHDDLARQCDLPW